MQDSGMEDALPTGQPAGADGPDRRNPKVPKTWTGEERRCMLDKLREFEMLSETFRSIRQNRKLDSE